METSIMLLLIILILFSGLSFLVLMNTLKKISEDVEEMRIDATQKKIEKEMNRMEHKMPTPTFFEPVTVDDLK